MAAARKRSQSKARKGTAGKRKTALRKGTAKKARTKTTGRVKGARGGPATREHPQSEPTKRASSKRREQDVQTTSNRRAKKTATPATDITEGDVKKIPGLAGARAKDTRDNATSGKPKRSGARTKQR